jgi:hypothetical protein
MPSKREQACLVLVPCLRTCTDNRHQLSRNQLTSRKQRAMETQPSQQGMYGREWWLPRPPSRRRMKCVSSAFSDRATHPCHTGMMGHLGSADAPHPSVSSFLAWWWGRTRRAEENPRTGWLIGDRKHFSAHARARSPVRWAGSIIPTHAVMGRSPSGADLGVI